MTIHVLHAGDGYLYLIRSVAVNDGHLTAGASLASYYTASGQPPGQWAGKGAARLSVSGTVTEEQMRLLFGEGVHPNASVLRGSYVAAGMSEAAAVQATRLGRRFPKYGNAAALKPLARAAYQERESVLGHRELNDDERLAARQAAAGHEFQKRTGRLPLDPVELQFLGSATPPRREAVAGYDLVFTPVKSVTALWGLAAEDTRQQIFEAHQAAVTDALHWLESNVALTRTGNRGQAQINTLGVIAAQFHHWDSRAGDPDLHTHVAISNKVQGPDEKWRSLDGRTMFAAAVSVSERYNTRIEDELRSRLHVEFEERSGRGDGRRSVREIVGMPQSILETFSKRRHGIEQRYQEFFRDYQSRHGHEPAPSTRHALYQQATLNERPEKLHGRSLEQMVSSWQQEAAAVLGTADAARVVEQMTLHRLKDRESADVPALAEGVMTALTASRATWNVHHVRAEAHRQARRLTVDDRDQLIEAIVTSATGPARSVRISTPHTLAEPDALRRADGESVFVEHGSALYTTTDILGAEERIVAAARVRTAHHLDLVTIQEAIDLSNRDGRTLNVGQVAMVRAFCSSGLVVQLGLAAAGTGKTTAMRVVADTWQASGRRVVALAPSAAAADVLGHELAIPADTLAKFDHDRPDIAPGTLLLVDEAGMAGTLVLDRLITRAKGAGAVVRLLGDDQQLAAVEAGGVLRHIDHEVGAVRMHEVVRFADPREADATLQVRDGIPAAADFYLDRCRVLAGTTTTMPEAAYAAWLNDVNEGRDSLLLATSTSTVAELNARARADLILSGQVKVDGVPLRDGTAAGVGDRVATRRNERRLAVNGGRDWVKNGDGWCVRAVHADGGLTVEHRRHRGRITLPSDYVAAHVELDYARTVRRAQGLTVDHAHLLVDPQLTREEFYVGVSRARQGTMMYVASMTDEGPDHHPQMAGATREVLTSIITRSGIEPSASEAIRDAVARLGDLRRMAVEYEYALGVHVGDRYRAAAEAARPGVTADPAWPSVAERLHLAEGAGWRAVDILRRAEQMGGYADARSDTSVLVFRLDRLLHSNLRDSASPPPVARWLAAAPPSSTVSPWNTYLPARYAEMADRVTTLAATATSEPEPWLTRIGASALSTEAIRQTVSYRAVYQVAGDDPLGPEPDRHGRQHDAWSTARRAIAASFTASQNEGDSGAARILTALDHDDRRSAADLTSPSRTGPTRHL